MSRTLDDRPTVTLVIGAGGVKCAAAIGVAMALDEAGICIDRVVGCSGGAMFAAGIAVGMDAQEMKEITLRAWGSNVTSRRSPLGFLRLLAPRAFGFRPHNFSLFDDFLIRRSLRDVFGTQRIEDTPIPLHITATDFLHGQLTDITHGDMVDAIRASVSLPFAFRPVEINGRLLVDGYLSDPLPVGVAMKHGSRVIVAVGFGSPYLRNIRNATRFGLQMNAILSNNLMQARLALQTAVHHSEVIVMMPQFKQTIRLFDTGKVPYIIEEGKRAAEQHIPYMRSLLEAGIEREMSALR
jgi:NTE family protein